MTREETFYTLEAVYNTLKRLAEPDTLQRLSDVSVHALGEAMGIVSKARAMVGRDIDEARTTAGAAAGGHGGGASGAGD